MHINVSFDNLMDNSVWLVKHFPEIEHADALYSGGVCPQWGIVSSFNIVVFSFFMRLFARSIVEDRRVTLPNDAAQINA